MGKHGYDKAKHEAEKKRHEDDKKRKKDKKDKRSLSFKQFTGMKEKDIETWLDNNPGKVNKVLADLIFNMMEIEDD